MIRLGQVVGLCTIALLSVGVLMVNSADMMVSRVTSANDVVTPVTVVTVLKSRAAIYMVLACIGAVLGSRFPVRGVAEWLEKRWSGPAVLGVMAFMVLVLMAFCGLVYVPGIQDARNGAHRWIALGIPGLKDLSMQPSEVAKWAMVPLMAWYCTARAKQLPRFIVGLVPAMMAVGAVAGLIVVEDLGTGVLVASVACLVLLAGGAKFWQFAVPGLVGAGGIAAAIFTSEYRMNRVKAFLDPYANPDSIGFHTIQGLIAIHNGEGVGRGLGEGLQKRGYLPEDRTDYIMAVVCEELGIAGAAVVMVLLITLIWAGVSIARQERHPLLKLWSFGIVATVGLQATINLLVVTGLAPAKGIALPLISFGGTGWILTAFSLGLLISIDRTMAVKAEQDVTAQTPAVAA